MPAISILLNYIDKSLRVLGFLRLCFGLHSKRLLKILGCFVNGVTQHFGLLFRHLVVPAVFANNFTDNLWVVAQHQHIVAVQGKLAHNHTFLSDDCRLEGFSLFADAAFQGFLSRLKDYGLPEVWKTPYLIVVQFYEQESLCLPFLWFDSRRSIFHRFINVRPEGEHEREKSSDDISIFGRKTPFQNHIN